MNRFERWIVLTMACGVATLARADAPAQGWPFHGHDPGEQRFSPLEQIHVGNVQDLSLAWSYATNTKRGLESTPIVEDGVMYATGTWSVVFALDARSGKELWRYDPRVPRERGRMGCCDVVNRGVALRAGKVYVGTFDARLIALDARTGKRIWEVQTADPSLPYTITGAPRIVKDSVLIGNGGAELGVRGYVTAYDAETGRQRWRFYTVPPKPPAKPEHPELEMALETWSKDSMWETGLGGTVWDSMAYDAELDLLYVGVGNGTPYDRSKRSPGGGDNLFLASILAIRPDTGRLVWHYQTVPGENWDYTATQQMILAELEIGGTMRKVLMQAPKNGFFYVLDRETGELLSADAYVPVSWATHVDLASGRPVEREDADWTRSDGLTFVMPSPMGGHNWHPMSYSPETGLVYLPTRDYAYPFAAERNFKLAPGSFNTGEDFSEIEFIAKPPTEFCKPTQLTAWDPVARKSAWRVEFDTTLDGGVLSTAGNLVFHGNGSGKFAAYDARSGDRVWEFDVGIPIMAPPISYRIDGRQYVALLAGGGGAAGQNFYQFRLGNAGHVLAFALEGDASWSPPPPPVPGVVVVPPRETDEAALERGRKAYTANCGRCHGMQAASGGLMPDLRHASLEVHENFQAIVRGGAYASRGMASFADVLSAEEVDEIQAYVIHQAHHTDGQLERFVRWAGSHICVPARWVAD